MGSESDVTVTSLDDQGQIVSKTEPMEDPVKEPEKVEPEKSVEETAKAEPEVEEPAKEEETPELEAKEEPVTEEPAKKGKSRFVKRIDTLTREKYRLEGEKAQLQESLERSRQAPKPAEEVAPVADPNEPKEDDYEVYADYLDARTDWRTDKRWAEHEEKQAQQVQNSARQKSFDSYNERVSRATEVFPDWVEVMDQVTKPLPPSAQMAIVELENSPEVMYHLAKDAELREKIGSMSDLGQVLTIGRISELLSKTEKKATEPSTPVENPAQTKVPSQAPKPIKPVGAGATKTHRALDDDEVPSEEFNLRRERGEV